MSVELIVTQKMFGYCLFCGGHFKILHVLKYACGLLLQGLKPKVRKSLGTRAEL